MHGSLRPKEWRDEMGEWAAGFSAAEVQKYKDRKCLQDAVAWQSQEASGHH